MIKLSAKTVFEWQVRPSSFVATRDKMRRSAQQPASIPPPPPPPNHHSPAPLDKYPLQGTLKGMYGTSVAGNTASGLTRPFSADLVSHVSLHPPRRRRGPLFLRQRAKLLDIGTVEHHRE
jgi:hypothetical protein